MALNLVHEIRLGAVRASIWREENDGNTSHSVTLSRTCSGSAAVRGGNRFEVDELPLVAEVVDLAHLWIFEQAELIA